MSLSKHDNSAEALAYLSFTVLRSMGKRENGLSPELLYMFDVADIFKLSKMYGGKYIKIPTVAKLQQSINVVLYLYSKIAFKLEDDEYKERFSITATEFRHIQDAYKKWMKYVKKNKIVVPEYMFRSNSKILKQLNILLHCGGGSLEEHKTRKKISKKSKKIYKDKSKRKKAKEKEKRK